MLTSVFLFTGSYIKGGGWRSSVRDHNLVAGDILSALILNMAVLHTSFKTTFFVQELVRSTMTLGMKWSSNHLFQFWWTFGPHGADHAA